MASKIFPSRFLALSVCFSSKALPSFAVTFPDQTKQVYERRNGKSLPHNSNSRSAAIGILTFRGRSIYTYTPVVSPKELSIPSSQCRFSTIPEGQFSRTSRDSRSRKDGETEVFLCICQHSFLILKDQPSARLVRHSCRVKRFRINLPRK